MTAVRRPVAVALPVADDFNIHWRLTTRWADNDVYGHLNNAVYYALFDSALTSWLIAASGLAMLAGPERSRTCGDLVSVYTRGVVPGCRQRPYRSGAAGTH